MDQRRCRLRCSAIPQCRLHPTWRRAPCGSREVPFATSGVDGPRKIRFGPFVSLTRTEPEPGWRRGRHLPGSGLGGLDLKLDVDLVAEQRLVTAERDVEVDAVLLAADRGAGREAD